MNNAMMRTKMYAEVSNCSRIDKIPVSIKPLRRLCSVIFLIYDLWMYAGTQKYMC
jgi:hypothetical protein